ncbi:zinc finger A20 and AN1 domain-containing stress-associated protein 8-like [Elaeis guineensis]|uniref:Zinc finger A20 and AN1 domain-containing stress-associated protein 8-like n=1 Tax=Elaeis guineensis var. tenera TaxID=51953 RepID=A0A6I9QY50_ELAGV|nr:zinc finger A20 and AN1 domain-containing stress-associated protein 8-like [Elaeis guineensis]
MASEEGCKNPSLCANGCGFFGSSTTLNLCSKCFKAFCLDQQQPVAPIAIVTMNAMVDEGGDGTTHSPTAGAVLPSSSGGESAKQRCNRCNKRVGPAGGFKCRCGATYCAVHRYPEEHECTFDYKAAGRSAIAKANPVVRANKFEKI